MYPTLQYGYGPTDPGWPKPADSQYQQFSQQPLSPLTNYENLVRGDYRLSGALEYANEFIKNATMNGKIVYKEYKQDGLSKICYCLDSKGKIIPMCIIEIHAVLILNPRENGSFEAIVVEYQSGNFWGEL